MGLAERQGRRSPLVQVFQLGPSDPFLHVDPVEGIKDRFYKLYTISDTFTKEK